MGPTSLHTPHTPPHAAPSRFTILHLVAATTDGPPEAFPGQEYQVDRDRRYDDVSSCRRAYEQKQRGDNGCRGLRLLGEVTSRGVVCILIHATRTCRETPTPALSQRTFRPHRDSAKKQTKLICVVCILPVNRAIPMGKKLEGN